MLKIPIENVSLSSKNYREKPEKNFLQKRLVTFDLGQKTRL